MAAMIHFVSLGRFLVAEPGSFQAVEFPEIVFEPGGHHLGDWPSAFQDL